MSYFSLGEFVLEMMETGYWQHTTSAAREEMGNRPSAVSKVVFLTSRALTS